MKEGKAVKKRKTDKKEREREKEGWTKKELHNGMYTVHDADH